VHIVLEKFSLQRTNFFSLFVFLIVVSDGVSRTRSRDNELRESGGFGETCGGKSWFSQRDSILCDVLHSSLGGGNGKSGDARKDGSHGAVSLKASVNNFERVLKFCEKRESCSRGVVEIQGNARIGRLKTGRTLSTRTSCTCKIITSRQRAELEQQ
jgi:hypothetical protein